MDQLVESADLHDDAEGHQVDAAVAVITTAGIYPSEDEFRRVPRKNEIQDALKKAAKHLKLTNTQDWVVRADGREIDPTHTFKHEKLKGIVEIEWHKREGGGGRA